MLSVFSAERRCCAFGTVMVLGICLTGQGRAAVPPFTGLGDLPSGEVSSAAWGVSADGSVVVGGTGFAGAAYRDNVFSSSTMAFRWTHPEGMTAISPFGARQALAVSNDASVIAGEIGASSAGDTYGFRWPALDGNPSHIHLGWPNPPLVRVGGVSGDGRVVVGHSRYSFLPSPQFAYRWTAEDGFQSLGVPPGGLYASMQKPHAVSADGSVIVGSTGLFPGAGRYAFRWTESTGFTLLTGLLDGFSQEAWGVSADGTVIAGSAHDGTIRRPVRWLGDGSVVALDAGGISSGYATAVAADGLSIIGTVKSAANLESHPFIWDQQNGLRRLDDLLVSLGANLDGWTLTEATGICANGLTIVGYGRNPSGSTEAWIATIPEPAALPLIAASMLLTRRRRSPADCCWRMIECPAASFAPESLHFRGSRKILRDS
jgi:uncharacterized membrane protein